LSETFREITGKVLLHCPLAGAMLCRLFVEDGWLWLQERRDWSFKRFTANFRTSTSLTGTCSVTRGSTTVTPGTLTFSATDVGRQFRVGNGIPFTIVDVTAGVATLDNQYGGSTDVAATGMVLDAFITMPADFGRFLNVIDPVNQWQLHLWVTEQELALRDPARQFIQDPWAIVNGTYSPVPGSEGLIRYELWPYLLESRRYDYMAIRRPMPAVDTKSPTGPFQHRPDVVRQAALMKAAQWPGQGDRKNPYYQPQLAITLERQLLSMLENLERSDEETYLTMLDLTGVDRMRFAPLDSAWMQGHDALAAPGWGA